MTTELIKAKTELALVESQLKIEEAKARTAIIKQAAKPLAEHWDFVPHAVDKFSFRDPHFFADGFPHRHTPWSLKSDREDGKFFPLYETEMDLARIRGQSRNLAAFTSTAIGAVEALKNYVYGTGFTYTIQAAEGVQADELVKQAQRVIDKFIELNDYTGIIDAESHQRSREDGEVFMHLRADGSRVLLDIIEPDNVTEPANKREIEDWLEVTGKVPVSAFVTSWKFGILTPQRHTHETLGYHVVYDSAGNDWEWVPESQMVHIKRNVPRKAKRGVSDFVPVWEDIEAEARLRKNTAEGAAIQAAIAFIREHVPGTSKTDIVDFVAANATTNYGKSIKDGTRTTQVEKFQSGTVKDIPEGMKYHAGPMGTLRSPIFIEVAQFILRSIGQRWSFPEFIISGDASNANFASTLVAESPFVKARECDQAFYKRGDSELLWKVLRLAWDNGRLKGDWQQIEQSIEVKIDAPEVASRDKQKQASTDEILQRMGVKSRRTIAAEHGLDLGEELRNMEEDGDPQPGEGESQPLSEAARFLGLSLTEASGCGTGTGGFGSGNTCAKGGSGRTGRSLESATRNDAGDLVLAGGSKVPAHIEKLRIPPAWSDVEINPDAQGDLLARGRDAKGRSQRIYSDSFSSKQAEKKFSRTRELIIKSDGIKTQNAANLTSSNLETRSSAQVMTLIQETGIRPGSDRDTKAAKKAFGATTLEGRHVVVEGDSVSLQFTGKKGVELNIPINNPQLANMLKDNKQKSGSDGKLFQTNASELREYSKTLDGGGFKPKDFRTAKGTQTAISLIKQNPNPAKNMKEYKSRVRNVAVAVSKQLGNTPAIALQSYIDPVVFSGWRPTSG